MSKLAFYVYLILLILSQRDNDGGRGAGRNNFVDVQFTNPSNCEKWTEMIGYEVHRRHHTTSLDLCPYYVVSVMQLYFV